MLTIFTQIVLYAFIVQAFSLDDFSNEILNEMIDDGKNQYQLLQDRGKLPRYGECWTSAVEHIHEGCRYLTEDVQSDIALRITNCFLEMSGHETYNCNLDKKPNLRGICINSMTDRAFNVYTEFYTHAQNICWFLRGQVWQEKISERTFQVGEQLKVSVNQQEKLLQQQKEGLVMQQELLNYGRSLEKILIQSKFQVETVMKEIRLSSEQHQQLLAVMSNSLTGLQSWLIGEISWFDSLVFYMGGAFIVIVITSTSRTASARLPLLFTLCMNIVLERIICDRINFDADKLQIHLTHQSLYKYIWWCRQFTIVICVLIIIAQVYFYRDYVAVNNALLLKIQEQNFAIKSELEKIQSPTNYDDKFNVIQKSSYLRRSVEPEVIKLVENNYFKSTHSDTISDISKNSNSSSYSFTENHYSNPRHIISKRSSVSTSRDAFDSVNEKLSSSTRNSDNNSPFVHKYNLRNRQDTPVRTTNYC